MLKNRMNPIDTGTKNTNVKLKNIMDSYIIILRQVHMAQAGLQLAM